MPADVFVLQTSIHAHVTTSLASSPVGVLLELDRLRLDAVTSMVRSPGRALRFVPPVAPPLPPPRESSALAGLGGAVKPLHTLFLRPWNDQATRDVQVNGATCFKTYAHSVTCVNARGHVAFIETRAKVLFVSPPSEQAYIF